MATVLIAGMGGLGCTVSQWLVRSGIGRLILIDDQAVAPSDLNRQSLFTLGDVGKSKIAVAAKKLKAIHGLTEITTLRKQIEDGQEFKTIMLKYHFNGIADCLDNFKSRLVLEDLLRSDTFLVHGGVQGDYGQITTIMKNKTCGYRAIYQRGRKKLSPIPVSPTAVSTIGTLMTQEILNNIWGSPQLLNTLLVAELSDFSFFKIPLK